MVRGDTLRHFVFKEIFIHGRRSCHAASGGKGDLVTAVGRIAGGIAPVYIRAATIVHNNAAVRV